MLTKLRMLEKRIQFLIYWDVAFLFQRMELPSTLWGNDSRKNGSIRQINHCNPLSRTNLSNRKDKLNSTHWVTLRPRYSSENNSKASEVNHHSYILQDIKANIF